MPPIARPLVLIFCLSIPLHGQCAKDNRSNKNAGIRISDFSITGTKTISAPELDRITSDLIGSCFDEYSEEMQERVRVSFQQRGYFSAEVKSLRFKASDPLGIPKPVTLEGEVSEGPQYRLADVNFLNNHAFTAEELRHSFPIKKDELVERDKVASGLQSLRKVYAARGFLDMVSIPNTEFASNASMSLNISIEEGPQYHMGKLEILGPREAVARLRTEWKLAEGDVYDNTYINQFLDASRDLLPSGFSRMNAESFRNCPEALIEVRLILAPEEKADHSQLKNVPCEELRKSDNQDGAFGTNK